MSSVSNGSETRRSIRAIARRAPSIKSLKKKKDNAQRKSNPTQDIVIAVMGPTGTGKSNFIARAAESPDTEEAALVGHSLDSCTHLIQTVRCRHPDGTRDVVLVDTPGFDDTNLSDATILEMIALWLAKAYKDGKKLSGLLFMHRITDNRMGRSQLTNLKMFRKLCGDNVLSNVLLVTTMWDEQIDEDAGIQREYELRKEHWKPMLAAGSRMARFNNTRESAWRVIRQLDRCSPSAVQIQVEMVDKGLPLDRTEAGKVLYQWLASLIKYFQSVIKQLEERLRGNKGDGVPILVDAKADAEQKLKGVQHQMQSFATSDPTQPSNEIGGPCDTMDDIQPFQKRTHALLRTIKTLMQALTLADNVVTPGVKGAVGLALNIAKYIQGHNIVEESLIQMAQSAGNLASAIALQADIEPLSKDMQQIVIDLVEDLEQVFSQLDTLASHSKIAQFFAQESERRMIEEYTRRIAQAYSRFESLTSVRIHAAINRIEARLAAFPVGPPRRSST